MSRPGRRFLAATIATALLTSPLLVSPALADLEADPGGPYRGVVGIPVQFDGSGSESDDGGIKSYQWDFGDGATGKGADTSHTYQSAGVYQVTLRVSDKEKPPNRSTASTTARIIDPTPTSPTTTTSSTLPSTSTTTTTTTIPFDPTTIPYDPTTTTTTSATTTTSTATTTTRPPTVFTTTATTTSTTAPPTTTSTEPTGQVLGQTLEATGPASGLSAASFSLVPATVSPGSEIALSLNLIARVPGTAAVQFLLDGEPLGEPATLHAYDSSAKDASQAVFTRTLPTGMQIGLHRVEVVTVEELPQILASRTVGVVAGASTRAVALDQTVPPSPNRSGLTVAIALAAVVALAGAGFAGISWYRRKAIVRRLNP